MRGQLRGLTILGCLAGAALALGSCQSSCSGDPHTDDLFCAQAGLSSGRYAQETSRLSGAANDRAAAASAMKTRSERARAEAQASKRQAAGLAGRKAAQDRELAGLQGELAGLNRQLAAARDAGRSSADTQALEGQIRKLKADIARLSRL